MRAQDRAAQGVASRSLRHVRHGWWKALGIAGVAGVAATGVVVARHERTRRAYTPEQIRDRLQDRYAELGEQARQEAVESWRSRREG